MDIALASLEDLIITKLEWSEPGDSELQRRDLARHKANFRALAAPQPTAGIGDSSEGRQMTSY